MKHQRRAIAAVTVVAVAILVVVAVAGGSVAYLTFSPMGKTTPTTNSTTTLVTTTLTSYSGQICWGLFCPDTGDIVNGPITINASQYNFYQFSIQYGAQNISVHVQWSSGGSISIYVVNATELISWRSGLGLHSFYNSGQSAQGDITMSLPRDDLYYLVFDNTLSTVPKNIQVSSGFSFMCGLCYSAPVQNINSSGASCVSSDGNEVCSVNLTNLGSVETSPSGTCVESWSLQEGPMLTWGEPRSGVFSPSAPIAHSANLTGACTVAGTTAPLGLAITVLIPLTDGSNVIMYGPITSSATTSVTQSQTMITSSLVPPENIPSNFTVTGEVPYLVITPQNHTFTLKYNVTAYNYPLNLSYDQSDGYAVQYSNNTQWVSTSRPCQTGTSSTYTTTVTSTGTNTSSITTQTGTPVIVVTQMPCGIPNGEWYPVNGTVLTPHSTLLPSEVQLTIQPTNVSAHTSSEVQVTVSIEMHPGVYAIYVFMYVQTPNYGPIGTLLGGISVIVQG